MVNIVLALGAVLVVTGLALLLEPVAMLTASGGLSSLQWDGMGLAFLGVLVVSVGIAHSGSLMGRKHRQRSRR